MAATKRYAVVKPDTGDIIQTLEVNTTGAAGDDAALRTALGALGTLVVLPEGAPLPVTTDRWTGTGWEPKPMPVS